MAGPPGPILFRYRKLAHPAPGVGDAGEVLKVSSGLVSWKSFERAVREVGQEIDGSATVAQINELLRATHG